MMKFRKKPVEVEAVQFLGHNYDEIAAFCPTVKVSGHYSGSPMTMEIIIPTLEGDHVGKVGDWIVKGVKGEFYPCKSDVFDLTYEPVEEA